MAYNPIHPCFLGREQTRKCEWFLRVFSWNDEFLKVDFKLDDIIFCDSSELKESWDPGEDDDKLWNSNSFMAK